MFLKCIFSNTKNTHTLHFLGVITNINILRKYKMEESDQPFFSFQIVFVKVKSSRSTERLWNNV